VTSIIIHSSIVTMVLWKEAHPDFRLRAQADSVELAARQAMAVNMVYIPPPAPSELDGRSRVKPPPELPKTLVPPPPPPEKVAPEKDPAKGDEGARSEEDNVAADGGASAPTAVPDGFGTPTPPTEAPRRHLPSIAFRGGTAGASSVTRTYDMPAWQQPPTLAGATPRCHPGPPRSATDPIEWGVVSGRVYRLGTTLPLVGATLQVLGTPYTTISDEQGDYTLKFDTWPLKNCEAQYVRVQLDGFVAQTLVLSMGVTNRSDVVLRGRN